MARLIGLIACLALTAAAQTEHFQKAGSCGRCHVISVVEWGISGHAKAGTDCIACHGKSDGHVIDERNNIKPERIPRGAAVAGLCATCHTGACPKSKKTEGCGDCHHFHALVDPTKPAIAKDERMDRVAADWQKADALIAEGDALAKARDWKQARVKFAAAAKLRTNDPAVTARVKQCDGWLRTSIPGFEIIGTERDAASGLPKHVRIAGVGIEMVLVPGGETDIGSDEYANARPVHTVTVEPVYFSKTEITGQQWQALTGAAAKQADMPADRISWDDAQAMLAKLNAQIAGGGFRLPTEAEWEHAARTGGWSTEGARFAEGSPRPVAQGRPNKIGLYDMAGNVWEWCSNAYAPYPFDAGSNAPLKVLRGGGFADTLLDPALRHSERPGRRLRSNGIRLARSAW